MGILAGLTGWRFYRWRGGLRGTGTVMAHITEKYLGSVIRRQSVGAMQAWRVVVLAGALAAGAAPAALAQQIPSAAEPGREAPRPVMPQPRMPGGAIVVPRAPSTEAPPRAETVSLTLRGIVIDGATAYTPDVLRGLYGDKIGQDITVADVFGIANAIEVMYRADGYITSQVVVPEQTIEDGVVRLQVIEGFVSEIVFSDDFGPALPAVQRLVEPLRGITPISVAEMERRLLIANDLPGLTIRASLEASPTVLGGSVVTVRGERKAVSATLSVDNRNSPFMGRRQATATAAANSIGPRADQLSMTVKSASTLRQSWLVAGGYQALLDDNGLTFGLNASMSNSRPGLTLKPLDVHSKTISGTGTLSYPLIRSREENLRLVGQLEVRNVSTDLLGAPFTRDRLRIARVGGSYDRLDGWDGITAVRGLIHQGIPVGGATERGDPEASRARGRSDHTKFTLDLTRVQQLPHNFSVLAAFTGQRALTPLLASEEIALGGGSFGRAFDEGEISGDNGWGGVLELRYSPDLPATPYVQAVQFYGYADRGEVWSLSGANARDRTAVASFGGGVRASVLEDAVFASLEYTKPQNRPVATAGDYGSRIFFNLTVQY